MAEATQMIILSIGSKGESLYDLSTSEGKVWLAALDVIKSQPGYKRLYWGLQVETPEKVQLHIVKDSLATHYSFLSSSAYTNFLTLLKPMTTSLPTIRHAMIHEFSPSCQSLGKGAPVTGTAIYLSTTPVWDAAWELWASIVCQVPGFLGIAGGHIIEEVDGKKNAFIALVGWENVEVHDAYHHTKHFRDRRRILLDPAKGFNYYGHLAFGETGLDGEKAKL